MVEDNMRVGRGVRIVLSVLKSIRSSACVKALMLAEKPTADDNWRLSLSKHYSSD